MPVIGHEKIISFFDRAIEGGKLSHAYCFSGCGSVGKRKIAKAIAAKIFGVEEEKLSSHPDFFCVERARDKKSGQLKKEVSKEQADGIKHSLQKKSWSAGGHQIVIVDEAELLNEESSNALLKTLEEPGGKNIIFLLTENDDTFLPTIKSRCQIFYFSLTPEKKIAEGLEKIGYDRKIADEAASFAWGRPGRAINFAADKDALAEFKKQMEILEKIVGEPFYRKMKEIEYIFEEKDEAVSVSEKLEKIFEVWTMWWRNKMLGDKNEENKKQAAKMIDKLKDAKIFLKQNINPKLLVEQIVLGF